MVKMTKSKTFQAYLPNCHRTYSCIHCRAHLANHDELISKSFQGSQGRAYLFNSVVNVGCGPAEERVLLTGLHAVADIYCENCKTTLGWKYVSNILKSLINVCMLKHRYLSSTYTDILGELALVLLYISRLYYSFAFLHLLECCRRSCYSGPQTKHEL
uniref:Protein yippee-like n=1 Tax=Melopsittacus undulatus TaxID=13146 RepID=A0A8V5GAC3_MELUD